MDRKHNSKIVLFAKELRKNMTKEERHSMIEILEGMRLAKFSWCLTDVFFKNLSKINGRAEFQNTADLFNREISSGKKICSLVA